jgi:DNA-3-methyladenine glycosylase I
VDVVLGDDGRPRCWWALSATDYVAYHDTEWGFPVDDDHRLFEKLALEGFQSGLSWLTILRKRSRFREVFHGFDYRRVAEMGEADVERLLQDAAIIRHRGKIEATISNAGRAIELTDEFGSLGAFFWEFEPERVGGVTEIPSVTDESTTMAKELKGRGFRFVGPTTAYAFMQAMGIVNDHLAGCFVRDEVAEARRVFPRPES